MAQSARQRTARGTRQARGNGAALTRETIVERALDLAERQGAAALSLRRLGDELGVDATAFYRHFRDKDELVLAMFDRIIGLQVENVRTLDPDLPWREKLRSMAATSWSSAQRHPAVFSLAYARTTGGPAEREVVEFILSALASTGLSREQAVLQYRMYADTTLAWCGMCGATRSLAPDLQEKDAGAWSRIYAVLPQEEYPAARAHASELAAVSDEAIYFAAVDAVLDGIQAAVDRAADA